MSTALFLRQKSFQSFKKQRKCAAINILNLLNSLKECNMTFMTCHFLSLNEGPN